MSKKKIKVIKKKDLNVLKEEPQKTAKAGTVAARNVVSNVSSWVSDFQQRKTAETKKAIESIFSNRPQKVSS